MWRIRRAPLMALAALALVLSACAGVAGGQRAPQRFLSVTGTGTARLAPDIVIVTLGVQTTGPDIAEAVSENNRRAEQVRSAIRQAGVADEDVQTSYFSVWTQQGYGPQGTLTGVVTYWVDNSLVVRLRDVDQLGELLDTVLSRGANSVQGVTFTVEDPRAALDAARVSALEDAHAQAVQIAEDAGVQLGEVLSIGEPGAYPLPLFEAPARAMGGGGADGAVPTTPGMLEISVQMSVSYSIR